MTMPQSPTGLVGFACIVAGTIGGMATSLFRLVAQAATSPATPIPSAVDVTATNGLILSIAVGVIGLLTQVVNGIFSGRKLRREVTERMEAAEAKAEAVQAESARKIADAEAKAQRKIEDAEAKAARDIADTKAENDRQHAASEAASEAAAVRRKAEREFANGRILELESTVKELREKQDRLIPHIETAARGIDRNSEGIKALAEAADIRVPSAPKMNGGHGRMDDPELGIGGPPA